MSRGKNNKNSLANTARKASGVLPQAAPSKAAAYSRHTINGNRPIDIAFREIARNFAHRGVKNTQGLKATFHIKLPLEEWDLVIDKNKLSIFKINPAINVLRTPDVSIEVLDDDFLRIVDGVINLQMAFMTGEMKVKGDLGLATRFGALFL
jgi:putative sterol carrier protein